MTKKFIQYIHHCPMLINNISVFWRDWQRSQVTLH